MKYVNPEDIKDYVSRNPKGIAGESKELSEMVNHFAKLLVQECSEFSRQHNLKKAGRSYLIHDAIEEHFGVEP